MERWDEEGEDDPLWKLAFEHHWNLSDFLAVGLVEALRGAGVKERDRVRTALLDTFHPLTMNSDAPLCTAEVFVDELDRICPEAP